MDAADFRRHAHQMADWIADYLSAASVSGAAARPAGRHPRVAARGGAGVRERSRRSSRDFERLLVPGLTHWNHPGFFAYFASPRARRESWVSSSRPRSTSRRCSGAPRGRDRAGGGLAGWLRQLLGLPTNSKASSTTRRRSRAACAPRPRERAVPGRARGGPVRTRRCAGPARVRLEHAHSSIDKAVILLGLGHRALREDPRRCAVPHAAGRAGRRDRRGPRGGSPADRRRGDGGHDLDHERGSGAGGRGDLPRESLWLHVDAAYAGVTAMVPGFERTLDGCDRADSLVVNPHSGCSRRST